MTNVQSNPYIFGDPQQDRRRLDTQTKLLGQYLGSHARAFFGDAVQSILDVGCGEGQLGFALLDVYPAAHLVGVDRDVEAIAVANRLAGERQRNAEFVAGDVQEGLPRGPFDVALASLLLMHTTRPQQVIQHIYDQLGSRGSLCVIELDPNLPARAEFGPDYQRLCELLYTALGRMGVHPYIMNELPGLLANAGFTDYTRRDTATDHPIVTHNQTEAMWAQAAGIGAIYNARFGISAATAVPVSEIERMVVAVTNRWTANPVMEMLPVYLVATARKP